MDTSSSRVVGAEVWHVNLSMPYAVEAGAYKYGLKDLMVERHANFQVCFADGTIKRTPASQR